MQRYIISILSCFVIHATSEAMDKPFNEGAGHAPEYQIEQVLNVSDLKEVRENQPIDTAEIERLAEAANHGSVEAMLRLGHWFLRVGKVEQAKGYFEDILGKTLYGGDEDEITQSALCALGSIELENCKNPQKAKPYYERADIVGSKLAPHNLAIIATAEGNNVEAKRLYQKSADLGHFSSYNNMGALFLSEGNKEEAEKYFERAAKADNGEAIHNLCVLLFSQKKFEEAKPWLLRGVKNNDPEAKFRLACIHELEKADKNKYKLLYKEAADAGISLARRRIADIFYKEGRVDFAIKYYSLLAEGGDTDVQDTLGIIYYQKEEFELAKKYLKMAADKGVIASCIVLSALYKKEGNLNGYVAYLRKAAELGDQESKDILARIYSRNSAPVSLDTKEQEKGSKARTKRTKKNI
ncbi:MAG: sel1 repeat family protein [Alphaproteobacteria bacterium]|jgi:TPR repeat protein|nr:sel1 repeat family protein [Alphaproteobacteria bacterium]